MSEWTATTRLLVALVAGLWVGGTVTDWLRAADRAHAEPMAWCANYDRVAVHPTPWERAHGRRVRWVPAPQCEEDR